MQTDAVNQKCGWTPKIFASGGSTLTVGRGGDYLFELSLTESA